MGVSSSGAMALCLGGNGGRTPPQSHTLSLWMLEDIDIIIRVFMKNLHTICL